MLILVSRFSIPLTKLKKVSYSSFIMKSTEASTIREALKRVGIELASDRIDELKEIYVQYLSQLEDMHNLDLDTSEVTGVFLPGPISELK